MKNNETERKNDEIFFEEEGERLKNSKQHLDRESIHI